jgi:hypothetical protein
MSPIDPKEAALFSFILSAASDTGRRAQRAMQPQVDSSKRIKSSSKPQRFSKLASDARRLATRAYPDTWLALLREAEAGRISLETVHRRTKRANAMVERFLDGLMEERWWQYCQLAAFISWASSSKNPRVSLATYARGFVPVDPPTVCEFVQFVPRAVALAERRGLNLDEIFPCPSDREARGA